MGRVDRLNIYVSSFVLFDYVSIVISFHPSIGSYLPHKAAIARQPLLPPSLGGRNGVSDGISPMKEGRWVSKVVRMYSAVRVR